MHSSLGSQISWVWKCYQGRSVITVNVGLEKELLGLELFRNFLRVHLRCICSRSTWDVVPRHSNIF